MVLMNFIVTQHALPFMEPESWVQCLEKATVRPCNEPSGPSSHLHTHSFFRIHFNFILPSILGPQSCPTTLGFPPKILYTFVFFNVYAIYPTNFIINLINPTILRHIFWKPRHVARQWHNKHISMRAAKSGNNRWNVGSGVFCWVQSISWGPMGQAKLVFGLWC